MRRCLGAGLDLLVTLGLVVLTPVLGTVMTGRSDEAFVLTGGFVGLGLALLYFLVCEGRWGRTLGKLAARTIVVDARGRVPGLRRAAVRTALRFIEVNPFFAGGMFAIGIIVATPAKQRIGDMLAGTYVVRLADIKAATADRDGMIAKVFA